MHSIAGKEFGDDQGKAIIIIRVFYGLKSLGSAWHAHFAYVLHDLGTKVAYS